MSSNIHDIKSLIDKPAVLQATQEIEQKQALELQIKALQDTSEELFSDGKDDLKFGKKQINQGIQFNAKNPNNLETAAYFSCAHESFKDSKNNFTKGLLLYEQSILLLKTEKDKCLVKYIRRQIELASKYYQNSYACYRGFIRHFESRIKKKASVKNNAVSKGYYPGLSHRLKVRADSEAKNGVNAVQKPNP